MQDFTRAEAEAKIGKKVSVISDDAFSEGIKKGTMGKVSTAEPSNRVGGDVWAVSVQFGKYGLHSVDQIHKQEYEEDLQEI